MKIFTPIKTTSIVNLLIIILVIGAGLSACKKSKDDAQSASKTSPLITAAGWETIRSFKFSIAGNVSGGFQAEDLRVTGDSVGVLYGEVYDIFRGLASGGTREYKSTFSLKNEDTQTKKVFETASLRDWINRPEYLESMYFANNTFNARLFSNYNSSSQTIPDRVAYTEIDEANRTIVPSYNLYKLCYLKQNVTHTADNSVVFVRSNPETTGNGAPVYMNYYDTNTKIWLSSTLPYENGMNYLSLNLNNKLPYTTGSWGFATDNAKYRAMLVDYNGGITIVQPNLTNHNFDTLARSSEPALTGLSDTRMVGGIANGNTFYGLMYSATKKKLYEYKWTEGSNAITKVFGDIAFERLSAPAFAAGNWHYFEMKPDGTAYNLQPSAGTDYDIVLSVVSASGVREVGRIKNGERSYGYVILPRYANGYYYAVAYIPVLAGAEKFPQLDVVRIKE